MNFKLRKTSKLNIFVAVFMCVLLLFCFCSTSYVQAADSLGDHYKDYVTFKSELAHTGYMSYFDHNNWIYNKDFKVGRDLSLSILSTDIPKWSNSSYKVSTSWKAFTSSVSGSYDVYCLFGANYDITYGSSTPLVFYFIVPSGSRICWGKDMSYSPSESMWQQSYFNVVTDASGIFCVRFRSVADKISAWSYGYCVKNGSSMSCDNKTCFRDEILTSGGNVCISIATDNVYNGESQLAPFTFTNIATIPVKNDVDYAPLDKFIAGDSSLATNADSSWSDKKEYPAESFYWDDMTCKPSSVGNSKYAFSFNYSYSCPLMKDTSEMFSCKVVYNSDIRYQDGKGRVHTWTDSKEDTFSLFQSTLRRTERPIFVFDEVGAIWNSRNYKDNISTELLKRLLQVRKNKIGIICTAQRFKFVDALLRQITGYLVCVNKTWRLLSVRYYDPVSFENCDNIDMIRPLSLSFKFVFNKDYEAYDTSAIVEDLKKTEMISDSEVLAGQGVVQPDIDFATGIKKRFRKRKR